MGKHSRKKQQERPPFEWYEPTPQYAGELMIGKQHLMVVGASAIEAHGDLIRGLIKGLPRQCLMHVTEVEHRIRPGPEQCIVTPVLPGSSSEPGIIILFAPFTREARALLAEAILWWLGPQKGPEFLIEIAKGPQPPILMLSDRPGTISEEMETAYAVTLKCLEALAKGEAIQPSLN